MTQTEPSLADRYAIARIYRDDLVIGAGFWLGGGYLLTCAHVVRGALGLSVADNPVGQTLQVDFPYVQLDQRLQAKVLSYQWQRNPGLPDQDLAGLQLLDPIPDAVRPVQFALSYQLAHTFYWVLGFPQGHAKGIGSTGRLLLEIPSGWVQIEDTKTEGIAIAPGFSGAPLWDLTTARVVGMVVARDTSQPEAKTAFMIPARHLLAAQRHLETLGLLTLLEDGGADEDKKAMAKAIATAYRWVCPAGWSQPETLSATLQRLQTVKQGNHEFAALDRFVALLALPEFHLSLPLRQQLRQWGQTRVENYPALESAAKAQWQAQVSAAKTAVSYLLIVTDVATGSGTGEANPTDSAYPVSALFIRDGAQYDAPSGIGAQPLTALAQAPFNGWVKQATLPQLIQTCVAEVLKQEPANLRVHLVLPLAWLQAPHDRHTCVPSTPLPIPLPEGPNRLGVRFSCSVGIAERLHPDVLLLYKAPWQQKWALLHRPGQIGGHCFICGDGLNPEPELSGQFLAETCGGFWLAQVYPEEPYAAMFAAAISAGIPAALWLRQAQFAEGVSGATALAALLTEGADLLPEVVKRCRRQATAMADNAHVGHHLSFLWEDPGLIPPSAQKSLGMPQP